MQRLYLTGVTNYPQIWTSRFFLQMYQPNLRTVQKYAKFHPLDYDGILEFLKSNRAKRSYFIGRAWNKISLGQVHRYLRVSGRVLKIISRPSHQKVPQRLWSIVTEQLEEAKVELCNISELFPDLLVQQNTCFGISDGLIERQAFEISRADLESRRIINRIKTQQCYIVWRPNPSSKFQLMRGHAGSKQLLGRFREKRISGKIPDDAEAVFTKASVINFGEIDTPTFDLVLANLVFSSGIRKVAVEAKTTLVFDGPDIKRLCDKDNNSVFFV